MFKKTICFIVLFLFLVGCTGQQEEREGEIEMVLKINHEVIPVTWYDNESVQDIYKDVMKKDIVVSMKMYGGNEQFGSLGKSYIENDVYTTTSNGDIVLYNSNNIVVFYGSNSWEYTRLGKMELDPAEVTALLSNGNITLTLSNS